MVKCFFVVLMVCAVILSGAPVKGRSEIIPLTPDSKVKGHVDLVEDNGTLTIQGEIHGLSPGQHGFHIHEFGDLGDQGNAAGSHYNPEGAPHGYFPKDGVLKSHAGDFGNIDVDENGDAKIDLTLQGLTLNGGKYNVAGRAFIVHEKKDDFGQPTGNAGGRVGGGTIIIVK